MPLTRWPNLPASVAAQLGLPGGRRIYAGPGGNTPQNLVNELAEAISKGEHRLAIITGAEALHTQLSAMRKQTELVGWEDDQPGEPEIWGKDIDSVSDIERAHNMYLPINAYALIENAIRADLGRGVPDHLKKLGELFAPFTKVAAQNPYSWFPTERSAEELSTPGPDNRFVGYPYTKYLNAIIQIDQSAALILTSAGTARELGIDPSRWVYLHGCADATDIWFLSERIDMARSPAINMMWQKASTMAGVALGDIDHFDIYSCFPSAVQIACRELGLATDDARGLTQTGGLPYFGGPGNNYVTHSIAEMMNTLRRAPGTTGLCNANGWYITKHALGIYSSRPPRRPFEREAPARYQADLDAMSHPTVAQVPSGHGTIETYTVPHARDGAFPAIVIGRLENDERFIALSGDDPATIQRFMKEDPLGRTGRVTPGEKTNLFELD